MSIVLFHGQRESKLIGVAIIFNEIQRMSILCGCPSKCGNTVTYKCVIRLDVTIYNYSTFGVSQPYNEDFLAKMVFAL